MMHNLKKLRSFKCWGVLLIAILWFEGAAFSQWRKVALPPWNVADPVTIIGVHFLDYVGSSEIGFAHGTGLFKTSDAGASWKKIDDRIYLTADITFKDSRTGWITYGQQDASGAYGGVAKTTNGGESWFELPLTGSGPPGLPSGIYYSQSSKLLLSAGGWNRGYNYRSPDEGENWEPMTGEGEVRLRFAFVSSDTGILSAHFAVGYKPIQPRIPWQWTTDGGRTWRDLRIDSNSWQPLAIPHTQTYFTLTPDGSFIRTDDNWSTWRVVYTFPPRDYGDHAERWQNTSTVRGNLDSLFVYTSLGVHLSTDQGASWESLCGPRHDWPKWHTFYVVGRTLFCSNPGTPFIDGMFAGTGHLWRLDLDSLDIATDMQCRFTNGKKTSVIEDAREVRVDCKIIDRTPDSARVRIRYDENAFQYSRAELPSGWTIRETIEPRVIDVTVVKGATASMTDSMFTLVFTTFISKERADLIVEAQKVFSYEFDASCVATLAQRPDTLTVLFEGCVNSILIDFMDGRGVLGEKAITIKSISPNPTQGSITIDYESKLSGAVTLSVYSVSGVLVHEQSIASDPSKPLQLNTTGWPSGAYTIVLRSGESEARGTVVKH